MIKVVDNIIPFHYQEMLKTVVMSDDFPWNYTDTFSSDGILPGGRRTSYNIKDIEYTRSYGFNHTLYFMQNNIEAPKSKYFDMFYPLILGCMDHVNMKQLIRSNLRLVTKIGDKPVTDEPHPDYTDKGIYSIVYYLHSTDGDTIFYNEDAKKEDKNKETINLTIAQSVTPKQGRAVFFNANKYHSPAHPSLTNSRVVLNVQYLGEDFNL